MAIIDEDFFFGEFLQEEGPISIDVNKFTFACDRIPSDRVGAHVERVLMANKGSFRVTSSSTYADLGVVLDAIGSENISKLVISTTTTVSKSIAYTYLVDIYMVNGVVRVTANWIDYKEQYFEDMVGSMVGGIYKANLQARTRVDVQGMPFEWLASDCRIVVKAFMKKALIMENDEGYESCLERCVNYVLPISYNE